MKEFDHIFAIRPSTVCNMQCSYCYRFDDLNFRYKMSDFDIESMIYHSNNHSNNLFNFCGYGETMLHPQFDDIIIELSKHTKVNWVTNGTQFNTKKFNNIMDNANITNIHDIVISVHFGQIKDTMSYISELRSIIGYFYANRIKFHVTTIVTDETVDYAMEYRQFLPELIFKQPFDTYTQDGKVINHEYSKDTLWILHRAGINPIKDYNAFDPPFFGKECPNGSRIFEVFHDGMIYDCSYDENKAVIGNINIKEPIKALYYPRKCKSHCNNCIPMLRDGFQLLRKYENTDISN